MASNNPSGNLYSDLPPSQSTGDFSGLAGIGFFAQVVGMHLDAIGAGYAAKSQQSALKSQALSAEFAQSMASINARAAEEDAQAILEAGKQQRMLLGLRAGAEKSARRASAAARGVVVGVGSSAEELASVTLAKEIDAMTIDVNATRAAAARRTEAQDLRNQGAIAGVSARNMRETARSISPTAAAVPSLLQGVGLLSNQFAYNRRYRR